MSSVLSNGQSGRQLEYLGLHPFNFENATITMLVRYLQQGGVLRVWGEKGSTDPTTWTNATGDGYRVPGELLELMQRLQLIKLMPTEHEQSRRMHSLVTYRVGLRDGWQRRWQKYRAYLI